MRGRWDRDRFATLFRFTPSRSALLRKPLRYGDGPPADFNGESVPILMHRKLEWKKVPDAREKEEREVQTSFSVANTRHKSIGAVLSSGPEPSATGRRTKSGSGHRTVQTRE